MNAAITASGLPIRAALHPQDGLYLALKQIPAAELTDPFLNETVARIEAPEDIVHIAADAEVTPADAPAGLVFSVGRSGSTLVSQLLKKSPGAVVYAEPQVINEIVVPPHKWGRRQLVGALRSVGAAFARHAGGRYVIKLSSWNTLFCGMIAEAFPETPWVFIARDPLETGVSVLAKLPGWYRADRENARQLSDIVDPMHASRSPDEYVSRAFAALCDAIGRLDPSRGKLVMYNELPEAVWTTIAPHFGMAVDAAAREAMREAATLYSKPGTGGPAAFIPDAAAKHRAASPILQRAVETFAAPALERLRRRLPSA